MVTHKNNPNEYIFVIKAYSVQYTGVMMMILVLLLVILVLMMVVFMMVSYSDKKLQDPGFVRMMIVRKIRKICLIMVGR